MLRYEMNTGYLQSEPRTNTDDDVLRVLRRVYVPGNHSLPVEGYRAEVVQVSAGCFCVVWKEATRLPLLSVAVAEDREAADRLWPDLIRYYDCVQDWLGSEILPVTTPTRPESEPWYTRVTMLADPDEVLFLGDFCRHFAWGWVDRRQWQKIAESPWGESTRRYRGRC